MLLPVSQPQQQQQQQQARPGTEGSGRGNGLPVYISRAEVCPPYPGYHQDQLNPIQYRVEGFDVSAFSPGVLQLLSLSSRDDEHLPPPCSVCALQVLALVVKAMREAPGGPWLKSMNIMEQMEKGGFRFHSTNFAVRSTFLRRIMKGEGRGLFAVTGTKSTSKYALVEVVGEQPEAPSRAAPLTEPETSPRRHKKKVRVDRRGTAQMILSRQWHGTPTIGW